MLGLAGQLKEGKVGQVSASAGEPKILLADEPTGNLDSLMARQVMELLHNLNQDGTTIIMVTHDPDQAREVSRNIQIIDGQISDFKIYEPLQKLQNSKTEMTKDEEQIDA